MLRNLDGYIPIRERGFYAVVMRESEAMIQRPGNCPRCGEFNPFHHASYYDPQKDAQSFAWIADWDLEVSSLLKEYRNLTVEHADGDWLYHLTKSDKTVEGWPIAVLLAGKSPAERVGRTWRQRAKSIKRPEGMSEGNAQSARIARGFEEPSHLEPSGR